MSATDAPLPPLGGVCLAGPTASGKTALALALAHALAPDRPVEVISVDSALVYRGMDIGTAKPDAAQQAGVPHHLIDVLDPSQSYSAARFAADARRLAHEIRARGALPLLVGGTMLYLKALREGLHALPPADPVLRAELDERAARLGWPALHAELARHDPATAASLAPRDAQRIQRALEVVLSSGRPMSAWLAGPAPSDGLAWPVLSLEPGDRAELHARIAQRWRQIVAAGFLQEMQALRQRGDLHADLPSMRCVGYRQAWEAWDRAVAAGHRDPAAVLAEPGAPWHDQAIAATRQLAKRQLTWLRSIPDRRALDPASADTPVQALHQLRAWAPRLAATDPGAQ